ncbi:FYVE and coiled-coil domain-containing protein 1-like isoform X1 [Asterias rubens]|uniref:FYVE and coiled-coil domain-containing protein 1-like isoform X1 n=1 Tax=Asterias rubens TaxID=7604 RepID=UPI0014554C91|nr:FYVE and coiled-coil domain-containing protein 1-like isoform X1 [Asterias rubens]
MAQPRSYPRIVQDITGCVNDLKKDSQDSQLPITDDSLALHKFCAKLEYLLQIDMKSRSGLLGGRRDYWDYFYKCMYKVKGLNDGLRFVKAMSEVKSSLGRGRAFIRYSLVHHRLGDSLQQCISNTKITSEWYNLSSVLLNAIHGATITTAVYDLNDIQFDLAPTGYDLDTAWPTFARKTLGAPSLYLWTPPSRTTSTSSINSQLSTSDSSYPNSPMTDSRPSPLGDQLVHLQKEFEDCELVNRQLRQRIDQLEKDNEDIHHMAQETEESMTALKQDSEKQNSDLQEQIISLEEKLNCKEAELLGMESKWKARVQEAEKTAADLHGRIEVLNKQHESREKMLIESEKGLRDNLAMAEISATELKQQANNYQLEFATRTASEQSAKEKMSDLENKLAAAEQRNLDMISRMNDIVLDKDKKVSSHFESASKVHELLARLEGAETEKLELKGVTEELIHKLQLIDTQRTAESESKQRSISEKEMEHPPEKESASGDEYPHQIKELENTNKKLISLNAEAAKKVGNLEAAIQKIASEKSALEKQGIEAQRTMSNLEESEWLLTEQIEELQKDIASTEKERDDLIEKVALLENRSMTEGKEREEDILTLMEENSRLMASMGLSEKELSFMKSACQQLIQSLEQYNTDSHSQLVECTDNPQMHIEPDPKLTATSHGHEDIGAQYTSLCLSLQSKISTVLAGKVSLVTHLQREVTDLKSHNAETLTQLKEKEEQDSMEVSNLRGTIKSLQGQLADAGLRSESQKEIETEKEKELLGYAEQMNILRQRVSDLKESVVQKSLELETTRQKLGQSKDQVESLKVALEKSQSEKAFLGTSISSTGKAFETLQAEHEQLQQETQDLQRYNEELHGESDSLKQVNRTMENMMEDSQRLQKENVSLEQVFEDRKQKMIKEHEDKVEFLTHQFNTIKDELDNVSAANAELDMQHQEMSVKLKEMQESCELMETERNEIKKTNDELNAEVSRVNESSQLIQSEKEEVAKKLEQLSSEMFQALEGNTTRMLRLENELHDAREERDNEKKRVSELEVEMTDTREKLSKAEQKCDEGTEQLSSLQCVMKQEISALKFQLSSEALEYQQNIQGYKDREADQQLLQQRLIELEENAESIQDTLDETRTQLQQQQQKAKEAVEALSEKEVERSVLQEAIQQMSKSMEELQLRNLNSEVKEELGMLKDSRQGNQTSLEAKLTELRTDNVDLKKQIIKLIRDKDTLWQWTDKLDYQRKMKASERWIDDNEVTHCMQCRIQFSMIVRRHHCRLCGRIFCTKCASCYVLTTHSSKKSRVCEQCFVVHQHASEVNQTLTTTLSTPDSDDEDEVSQGTPATSRSSISSNTHLQDALESTISTEGSSSIDGSISPIKVPIVTSGQAVKEEASLDHETATEDTVSTSILKTSTQEEGTDASEQDAKLIPSSKKVECAQVTASESSYHSETDQADNPVIVLDSPLPSRHNLHPSEKDDEPDFDVISEEEVVAARNEPCPFDSPLKVGHVAESSIIVTPTLYTTELEAGVNDDITIKAGQSHAIPIHLDAPGIVLCWEFASAPKTIAFSVTFQPGMELPASSDKTQVDELIPLCKCNSHRHAVQGELMARKAGIYTLLFDNSFSRFTQKTVKYSLQVKRPEAAY